MGFCGFLIDVYPILLLNNIFRLKADQFQLIISTSFRDF